ncbi:hypothetical protein Tco_0600421 [Tanacetum coccineum]|uniref:Retrotransposon gag domain-containing protein n=1 Tax=Tanacetum coccineum TaxID=301880 RepID=A0ABQ4WBR8_9ASTR
MEDQPLPADASPVALSPGYVPDSDPEEDPEEDSKEEAMADYPAEEDGEARKSVRPEPNRCRSIRRHALPEHAAALYTTPLPVVSSPVPLTSPLTTSPTDTGAPLGYRAAGIRMRAADASPPLSLPPTSPRTDIPEAEMPPRKRACLTTPAPGYEIGESSAAGAARQPGPYSPALDTWDEITSSEERSAAIEAHVRTLEAQVATLITQTTSLQTQLTTALGRIATLEARDPEPQDGPAEAGSSIVYFAVDGDLLFIMHMSRYVYDCVKPDVYYIPCDFEENVTNKKSHEDNTRHHNHSYHQLSTEGSTPSLMSRRLPAYKIARALKASMPDPNGQEKMESVFLISNYAITNQVKFASCTLQGSALTWWNSHVRAVGQDVAYTMPWTALKRMISRYVLPMGTRIQISWNLSTGT